MNDDDRWENVSFGNLDGWEALTLMELWAENVVEEVVGERERDYDWYRLW